MAGAGVGAGAAASAAAGGGSHILLIFGIIVLIVIVGGAAYFFVIAPSSSSGLKGTGSVSQQVQAILPANQSKSFSGVLQGVAHNIAAIPKVSIYYTGTATVGRSFLTFSIPINVTYEHYNDSSRLILNATKIPLVGNLTAIYVRVNSTATYSCTKFSNFTITNGTSKAPAFQCSPTRGVSNLLQALENPNSTTTGSITGGVATNSAFGVMLRSYGTRYYKGMPCLFVTGSANSTTRALQGTINSSYQMSMCLSGNYSVPLNFSLIGSSGTNATTTSHYSIILNEFFIGIPLSQASVAALPGPVVNSTV